MDNPSQKYAGGPGAGTVLGSGSFWRKFACVNFLFLALALRAGTVSLVNLTPAPISVYVVVVNMGDPIPTATLVSIPPGSTRFEMPHAAIWVGKNGDDPDSLPYAWVTGGNYDFSLIWNADDSYPAYYNETDHFPSASTPEDSELNMFDLFEVVARMMVFGVVCGSTVFAVRFLWRFFQRLLGESTWRE